MYVPFDRLPNEARVWIYSTNRDFSDEEVIVIQQELSAFLNRWTSHQHTLEASFSIPYNNFIVIGLNENKNSASGCSIDASVHFLKQLEKKFKVDLFDRMLITYKKNNQIKRLALHEFKRLAKQGEFSKSTTVFNNLVQTKKDFLSNWETIAEFSWHNSLF